VKPKLRLGVLASGNGSNLQALIDACGTPDFPAKIEVVISNVPTAQALERARKAGIPALVVDHRAHPGRDSFEKELLGVLSKHQTGVLCLAGFMRILSPDFLRSFPGRILNIHPALLPSFPGLHGARQALAHGVKITGCTVHLVDAGTDTGPIVVQAAVPVLPGDDEATLAARILVEEHRIYPLAVRAVAEGAVSLTGRVATVPGQPTIVGQSLHNPGKLVHAHPATKTEN